ncbi:MAG: HD domain-containing protein [Clostridium sp.]
MKLYKLLLKTTYSLSEILRVVRFSVESGFSMNNTLIYQIRTQCNFENVRYESIRKEFESILLSENVDKIIRKLQELNILQWIIPELSRGYGFNQRNKYHNKDVFEHTLSVTALVPRKINLRLAAIFHDLGKPLCFKIDQDGVGHFYGHEKISYLLSKDILHRWGYDEKISNSVGLLVINHMRKYKIANYESLKRLERAVGRGNIEELLELQIADNLSKNPMYVDVMPLVSLYLLNKKRGCL